MKRWMAWMLAVLMLWTAVPTCALGAAASGAGRAILIQTMSGEVSWIRNSGLLQVLAGNGAYGVYTPQGVMLTGSVYSELSGAYSVIIARDARSSSINCYGLLDSSGQVLAPFQYGAIRFLSERWMAALVVETADGGTGDMELDGVACNVVRTDLYALDPVRQLASLDRLPLSDIAEQDGCLNIRARDTGLVSTYSPAFELLGSGLNSLSDWTYAPQSPVAADGAEVIASVGGYAALKRDGRIGIVSADGGEVVPAEYDHLLLFGGARYTADGGWGCNPWDSGYAVLLKDDMVCFADLANRTVWNTGIASDAIAMNGASGIYTAADGSIHILAADGVDWTLEAQNNADMAPRTNGYFVQQMDAQGRIGLIDWHGNPAIPCRYAELQFSADGAYVLADAGNGSFDVYQLVYPAVQMSGTPSDASTPVPAAAEAPVTAPASTPIPAVTPAPTEAPEATLIPTLPNSAGSDATASAAALVSGAKELLELGARVNRDAAVAMLVRAIELLDDSNPAACSILQGVCSALNEDGAQNGEMAVQLLEEALGMLAGY